MVHKVWSIFYLALNLRTKSASHCYKPMKGLRKMRTCFEMITEQYHWGLSGRKHTLDCLYHSTTYIAKPNREKEGRLTDHRSCYSVGFEQFWFSLDFFTINSISYGFHTNLNLSRPNIPETKMERWWFWDALPQSHFYYRIHLGKWVISLVVLDSPSHVSIDKEWKMFSWVIGSQIHNHPSLAWAS